MSIAARTDRARRRADEREDARETRHLEVAATAAQRRARPRVIYAVIVVGGIGAILLAQLLLSIATADGAYRISALQTQARDYARQQAALDERLDVLRSTQNLTRDAEALGMVSSGDPVFLDATSGAVRGTATAAGGSLTGSGNLIGNALLSGSAIDPDAQGTAAGGSTAEGATADPSDPTATEEDGGISTGGAPATTTGGTTTGAPQPTPSPTSVPSAPGVLPSPTTH